MLYVLDVQIRRQFFRAMSSVECQRQLVSALVDVVVEAADLQSASVAVSCLRQVFKLHFPPNNFLSL